MNVNKQPRAKQAKAKDNVRIDVVTLKDRTPLATAEGLSYRIETARRELHALELAQRLCLRSAGMTEDEAFTWQQENVKKS